MKREMINHPELAEQKTKTPAQEFYDEDKDDQSRQGRMTSWPGSDEAFELAFGFVKNSLYNGSDCWYKCRKIHGNGWNRGKCDACKSGVCCRFGWKGCPWKSTWFYHSCVA